MDGWVKGLMISHWGGDVRDDLHLIDGWIGWMGWWMSRASGRWHAYASTHRDTAHRSHSREIGGIPMPLHTHTHTHLHTFSPAVRAALSWVSTQAMCACGADLGMSALS